MRLTNMDEVKISKRSIKACEKLIVKYNSITIPMINAAPGARMDSKARYLTGYGDDNLCSLCAAIPRIPRIQTTTWYSNRTVPNCSKCVHVHNIMQYTYTPFCAKQLSRESYLNIQSAKTALELKKAYRDRAKYLTQLLKKLTKK
jgi:hypothetical protein